MKERFSNDSVSFISISLDKEIQVWQKTIIASGEEKENHFLLTNPDNSTFKKQFNIDAIPRYMLIDKKGKVIYSDAPGPSDSRLGQLVEAALQQ
jgi:hypothetical protein